MYAPTLSAISCNKQKVKMSTVKISTKDDEEEHDDVDVVHTNKSIVAEEEDPEEDDGLDIDAI